MAFDVMAIAVIPSEDKVLWKMNLRWWPADELRKERRFLDVSTDLSYQDYEAVLTVKGAKTLHDRFKTMGSDWLKDEVSESARKLQEALKIKGAKIRIRIFEWESGF